MTTYFIMYLILCFLIGLISRSFSKAALLYIVATIMFISGQAKADTYYRFTYNNGLSVGVPAKDYFEARSKASKVCFQALTKGKYPGEEAGLEIIDLCANPKEK